jgi:hypothetical protein
MPSFSMTPRPTRLRQMVAAPSVYECHSMVVAKDFIFHGVPEEVNGEAIVGLSQVGSGRCQDSFK